MEHQIREFLDRLNRCSWAMTQRRDATWQSFCPERYEDVAEQTPPWRRAKRLQNAYAYHGPRTHQRRSHYLMAPTYVFAVSRSLREQSDMSETDRLPTTSTLPLFDRNPLFPSSLFFYSFLWHVFPFANVESVTLFRSFFDYIIKNKR